MELRRMTGYTELILIIFVVFLLFGAGNIPRG
ncbi:MAG: twin-arginine translocase TatA/TatE family subunit [Candidatus Brocadia sp.]|nr:twin-arginine translocase TatA/TatE family subunit [Candidatus Brocadia sp.]